MVLTNQALGIIVSRHEQSKYNKRQCEKVIYRGDLVKDITKHNSMIVVASKI